MCDLSLESILLRGKRVDSTCKETAHMVAKITQHSLLTVESFIDCLYDILKIPFHFYVTSSLHLAILWSGAMSSPVVVTGNNEYVV